MTAVSRFPLTPDMQARLAERDTALTCARAILRSPLPHAKEDVRLACHTMMTFGDQWDWAEAYPVLRALDARPATVAPVTVEPPPYSAGPGTIRRVIIGTAALVAVAWLGLVGWMVQ